MKDKIREICTFHGEDGTSGYLLDEQRFAKIFALLDNQKKAILDEIENKLGEFKCDNRNADDYGDHLLTAGRCQSLEDIKNVINNLK
ncbi:MAG: hypothetical protein RBR97_20190 [Bacteroidales bacterium]|nr:hypothetical protein [Bacteroidales bacterium]